MEAYVAGRVLQGYTQYRADKDKATYINRQTDNKAKNLREEAIYKDNSLIRQQEVKEDQLATQKFDLETKATETKGKAKVAFFEKGIGGNLYNAIIGDISRQQGIQSNRIDLNYENYIRAMSDNRLAYNRRFTNQILNLPRANKPSFMTYALETSMDIGSMYLSNQAPDIPGDNSQTFNLTYENYNSPR
jgi:hypothetical protein